MIVANLVLVTVLPQTHIKIFPVGIASKPINIRWIRTGSNYTEKSCSIVLQAIFHEYFLKIKKIIPYLLALAFGPSGLTKLVLIFYLNIR